MEYANTIWDESAYKALVAELKSLAEPGYKAFQERLCTTSKAEILGVRSPYVKKIAKPVAKGDVSGFLSVCETTYYEEVLLKAFVIAFWRCPLSEKWATVEAFVPQIDNWAVCDGFCAALKIRENEQAFLLTQCEKYSQKAGEYDRRFALVMLMDHLLSEPYLDAAFEIVSKTDCAPYYVSMAAAWCVSVLFVRDKEKTLAFLKTSALDDQTHRRAIQKIVESNRVTAEDKALVRTLRRA